MLKGLLTRLFALGLFLAAPSGAVDRAVSGLWYNPAQSGHGFEVTVISPSSVAITWYTYSPFATPIWVIGVLNETSPGVLTGTVDYYDGMRFGSFQPADLRQLPWGTLTMSLQTGSCDSATLAYNGTLTYQDGQGFGQGSIPIQKLIGVTGLECGASAGSASLQGVYLGFVRSAFSGDTINGYLAVDSQSNFVAIAPGFAIYTGRFSGTSNITSTITATPVAGVSFPSGRAFNASGTARAGDFVAASYSGSGDSGSINMFWLGASNRSLSRATLAGSYRDADLGQGFTGQIASGGQLTGSDAAGCQFSGQLPSAITNPFDVVVQVSNCLGAGTYSGKVIVTDWFAAGDNRALVVGLQGPGGAISSILIR